MGLKWKRAFLVAVYRRGEMPVDDVWLTPAPGKASKLWNFSSLLTISLISIFSKIWLGGFNTTVVHRKQVLLDAIDKREPKRPLITACNHYSMADDPVLAYMMSWGQLWNLSRLRWLLGAKDVCCKSFVTSLFFQLGKVLPVVRGDGVYQYCMNFCIDRLNAGEWVHIYPEGKINMQREMMRLKWGIGRLIADCKVCPIVIPYWHIGMEDVFPTVKPYDIYFGKDLTVLIGDPLDFEEDLRCLREQGKSEEEVRKYITDRIQDVFGELKLKTESLHKSRLKSDDSIIISNN